MAEVYFDEKRDFLSENEVYREGMKTILRKVNHYSNPKKRRKKMKNGFMTFTPFCIKMEQNLAKSVK